ncbi:response regulator receiver, CheY-like protein [Candidatus Vecturithrix granuli]|uniref:Response regulator receiver, CheY-like protein n=1 Tax=Vecturithrix granuli TaxID=1499967 RepID=A0A081BVH1_VECG1|nr:response regulator receiver, CheY-like protein [Candidatus Vecturithrix granuli]
MYQGKIAMDTQEKATILIVEDNPLTVYTLIEYLKKIGIHISVARNGEEALRQVKILQPNLILLDIMLPGIDGFETCQRLKNSFDTKEIPVIFMTAFSDTTNKVKAFEAGGTDYLTKPFDLKEIVARIETRLTIQKLQKRLHTRSLSTVRHEETEKAIILVAEDNEMTLHLICGYLEKLGFQTIKAMTGEDALIRLKEQTLPDLILLDVMMPGIDGFETCRQIKANPLTREIPVIFMTALTDISHKIKAFEVGGADYITKPHHYAEVIARVNTHLTLRTLQKLLRKKSE